MTNSRVLADLLTEAESAYENENYFAALACLFVATEQTLKERMDVSDGNFHELIERAIKSKKINDDEYRFILELKNYRNKLFHEDHYATGFVFDDLVYPAYESDTKKILYDIFEDRVFGFVLGS